MVALSAIWTRLDKLRAHLDSAASVLDFGIRLYVADVFMKSGLIKFADWDKTLFMFEEVYHVPVLPTHVAAVLGTFGELFFPALFAVGLATRFSALSLFVVNIVAVISYWHVLRGNEAALMSHFYWGALILVIFFHGPGRLSLDHWISKRMSAVLERDTERTV